MKGIELIESKRKVRITLTADQWQLYSTMDGADKVADKLNKMLNLVSQSCYDVGVARDIMYHYMSEFDDFGARDTEPECVLCDALEELFGTEVER